MGVAVCRPNQSADPAVQRIGAANFPENSLKIQPKISCFLNFCSGRQNQLTVRCAIPCLLALSIKQEAIDTLFKLRLNMTRAYDAIDRPIRAPGRPKHARRLIVLLFSPQRECPLSEFLIQCATFCKPSTCQPGTCIACLPERRQRGRRAAGVVAPAGSRRPASGCAPRHIPSRPHRGRKSGGPAGIATSCHKGGRL